MRDAPKIPCTVGMLAWNVGGTLERALENVRDFAEVVIADGGSTDDTLAIAARYGARVIAQSNPGHPIEDFSRERNSILDAATQPWFLWLDPDELISHELREEIRAICAQHAPAHFAYNLRIERVDPVTLEPYLDLHANYQMRFFHRKIEGRYRNRVHEQVAFDRVRFPVGTLKGAWYVPLSRLDLASYKATVDERFPALVRDKPAGTFGQYLKKGVVRPLSASLKIAVRVILLRVMHPGGHVVPWVVERGRLYTQWVVAREYARTYWGGGQ